MAIARDLNFLPIYLVLSYIATDRNGRILKSVAIYKNLKIVCLSIFMDLRILSVLEAVKFVPEVKTATMRIYGGYPPENDCYGALERNRNYVAEFSYVFDDVQGLSAQEVEEASRQQPDENPDTAFFSRNIANQIIRDFISVRERVECLMVHCRHGQGRSPGVAIALNEGFELGYDTVKLMKEYREFNRPVYEILLKTIRSFVY